MDDTLVVFLQILIKSNIKKKYTNYKHYIYIYIHIHMYLCVCVWGGGGAIF